jgi:hypothetical protein
MEDGKSIGKLYYDVEISVNCKKDLTHREKMDKLIDELDYLNTAEVESLLKTAETFKIKNEIGIIPTKDLVEELKKRMGVETFVVGVEDRYLLHLINPEYHGCGTMSEKGPATILIITD